MPPREVKIWTDHTVDDDEAGRHGHSPDDKDGEWNTLLLTLAVASGTFDAIIYVGLSNVFPANMTGNTILLGLRLGQGEWADALRAAVALAGFAAGVVVGSTVVERRQPKVAWPPAVTVALVLEAAVLVAVSIGWDVIGHEPAGGWLLGLILFAAAAMGIQSAAIRRLGVTGMATTAVTGTLTSMTSGLVRRSRADEKQEPDPSPGVALQAAVWGIYVGGAVAGGVAEAVWHGRAVVVPICAVLLVVAISSARHWRQRHSS